MELALNIQGIILEYMRNYLRVYVKLFPFMFVAIRVFMWNYPRINVKLGLNTCEIIIVCTGSVCMWNYPRIYVKLNNEYVRNKLRIYEELPTKICETTDEYMRNYLLINVK